MNFERPTPSGKRVQLSLVANPSHLEAEDPVVLGKTRAIQHYNNDEKTHRTAMSVLLHGDAAFAAQGIVYECLGFHSLPAFSTDWFHHRSSIRPIYRLLYRYCQGYRRTRFPR
ncbi:hypothetical protein LB505_004965 [Fusarium chuoi]|nr:hypothetical protein LB505_004965 [Fusarium chuoi]